MGANRTERILVISIGVLLVALAGVIASSLRERVVQVGDKAPNFTISTDDGRKFSRDDFGGRLLVLNFWATWCPPCIQEMPSLDEFQRQLRSSGVVVLGVSVDHNEAAYKAFLQRARISFLTARDPGAEISADYGTFKYPETYVISADGRVLQKYIGPEVWTDEKLISGIRALL